MSKRFTGVVGLFCLAVFLSGSSGCFFGGGSTVKVQTVEGSLTLDGKPLENCSVAFSPVDSAKGAPASGITDSKGNFKFEVQAGKYKVELTPQLIPAEKKDDKGAKPTDTDTLPSPKNLPEGYNNPNKENLFEVDIAPGMAEVTKKYETLEMKVK